ncbi:MAG: ThuA domain-containing protein [Planctomycetaceae bacterium]|jgi:type 1 glutamine amidotransferase|nr:ThuA domain-containing protein [Planctomycetaceae bacterium]
MRKNNLVVLCILVVLVIAEANVVFGQTDETAKIRVLVVTGEDHPSHNWREVAPILRNNLNTDKAIDCRLSDDLEMLGTDVIFDYDVLVCYFKNYKPLKRDEQVKKNLTTFIENGGGLVLIHFTCGAFEGELWFEQIVGRVWDPKKRAHDPYGEFEVEYVDNKHPITNGLKNFKIADELYTCLKDSKITIHVLAESTSKVDKKRYPMVFVLEKGKGKIFHTTLGHNIQSVSNPDFKILLQRAVYWMKNRTL